MKTVNSKFNFFLVLSILIFNFQNLNSQDLSFTLHDQNSEKTIEYVTVDLLNGKGVYSNQSGLVEYNFDDVEEIEISHISYFSKKIKIKEIKEKVYLKPKDLKLNEVVIINNQKKKFSEINIVNNSTEKKYFFDFGTYGTLLVSKIDNPIKKDIYVHELIMPFVYDEIYMSVNKQDKVQNIILSTNFYNLNDTLLKFPLRDNQFFIVSNKDIKRKKTSLKLKDKIKIDSSGILFAITFIGKANENGDLIFENPNYFTKFKGDIMKMTKYIPIQIPLVIEEKELKTFAGNIFSEEFSLTRVVPRIATPYLASREDRIRLNEDIKKQYPNFTIEIGVKYYFYE